MNTHAINGGAINGNAGNVQEMALRCIYDEKLVRLRSLRYILLHCIESLDIRHPPHSPLALWNSNDDCKLIRIDSHKFQQVFVSLRDDMHRNVNPEARCLISDKKVCPCTLGGCSC